MLLKPLIAALRMALGPLYLQHDYSVANDTGSAVRADINNLAQAIATVNSGATAPATSFAYQLWADTTAGLLKQRNAANTGWLVRGSLAESFVLSRSTDTILGVGDFGRVINATAGFTQTFTAAATLADGWWIVYKNNSSANITLDPNAAEQIDGAATLVLAPGESCVIWCNGSAFFTIGLNKINSLTADATPDPAADYVSTYDASASTLKKVLLSALFGAINSLTEDTSPDLAADFLLTYDTSAAAVKKVLGGRLSMTESSETALSGTAVTISSIPSWVKRLTIRVVGASLSGTANLLLQLGDSGGLETTGYTSSTMRAAGATATSTSGFLMSSSSAAADTYRGWIVIEREDSSDNTWVCAAIVSQSANGVLNVSAGDKALTATLDRFSLTTSNGTDTFDGGVLSWTMQG